MIRQLRHHIARWLLADEVARIDLERESFKRAKEALQQQKQEHRAFVDSLTITDMIREQLAGFDPKLLDDERDLPEILGDVADQNPFLAEVKSLRDNDALQTIITYLIRNQVMYSAKQAVSIQEMNFGRATVNGLQLLRDEIDRLTAIYEERHPKGEEYDKHEVT